MEDAHREVLNGENGRLSIWTMNENEVNPSTSVDMDNTE